MSKMYCILFFLKSLVLEDVTHTCDVCTHDLLNRWLGKIIYNLLNKWLGKRIYEIGI